MKTLLDRLDAGVTWRFGSGSWGATLLSNFISGKANASLNASKGDGRSVTVTRYRCDRCGSIWDYENDKANQQAGWSLPRR